MARGRPPGSKNKPKSEAAPAGPGHNSQLTEDQQQKLLLQSMRAIAEMKAKIAALTGDLRNLYKVAKSDGFTKAEIDFALSLDNDEDEKMLERRRREQMIARWLGHPVGTQADMFDGVDRTPSVDKAYAEGKRTGMEGKSCVAPYDAAGEQAQHWIRGWHDGQAVKVETGIRQLQPGETELIPAETAARTPDPFADALDEDAEEDGEPWPDDEQIGSRETEPETEEA